MALRATVFKAALNISDLDRAVYGDYAVTIARHPSENDERMMVRILAFCLHADELLAFADSMSLDEEPSLWRKDLTGAIDLWVDVGEPDGKRIRKACGRAKQVVVYRYGTHSDRIWWGQVREELSRFRNLTVVSLPSAATQALAVLAQRSLELHCMVQDGQVWIGDGATTVHVEMKTLVAG